MERKDTLAVILSSEIPILWKIKLYFQKFQVVEAI